MTVLDVIERFWLDAEYEKCLIYWQEWGFTNE